ncbi:hypothetical protein M0638_08575 [Roseomonas sp. NAR14]|uniref:Rhamnogalacturonase A/B/Epimerase-like pectate lyase domain-containing protein n=1 Tax=Roseomonas acroporae TaxID=2937791 RepID=A0A9X1Y7A5_9PROT|nr:glycosyl hydrolase family 28-related protein [Roseomonas acroporae]MCK8784432.1 hypothetical protein [Roseomonas acroporae]
MADAKITDLPSASTLSDTDLAPIVQGNGSGAETRRATVAQLRAGVTGERLVHVRDFGATGDGVTDDTAAFVAALAAGSRVELTRGRTYVVGELTITGGHTLEGNGATLRARAGAAYILKLSGLRPQLHNLELEDGTLALPRQTTLATAAATGATSLAVASGSGIQARMTVAVELDSGDWHLALATAATGGAVTLDRALPGAAAAGRRLRAVHAALWLTDAQRFVVSRVLFTSCWGALVAKPEAAGGTGPRNGEISHLRGTGARLFGAAAYAGAADILWADLGFDGADATSGTAVATGAAAFTLPARAFLRSEVSVSVNGVAQDASRWSFASGGAAIQFANGYVPASGASVAMSVVQRGARGLYFDGTVAAANGAGQRLADVTVSGAAVGLHLRAAAAVLCRDLVVAAPSLDGVRIEDGLADARFSGCAVAGAGGATLRASGTCTRVLMEGLQTARAAAADRADGLLGDNVVLASGTIVAIDTASWRGPDFVVSGGGSAPGALSPAAAMPAGGTAARPASPVKGQFRYNTDTDRMEVFAGATGAWGEPALRGGDTMTGPLTLAGDPTAALHAATKQYVDANAGGGGGSFTQSGTGAVTRTSADKLRESVSVLDFGASGNNSTDNVAAFGKAIAYLAGRGGGRLLVPAGIYVMASALAMPATSRVTLVGESANSTVLRFTAAAGNGISFTDDYHCGLERLAVEAGAGRQAAGFYGQGSTGVAVRLTRCNFGTRLDKVSVCNFADLVQLLGCWDVRLNDLFMHCFSGTGLLIDRDRTAGTAAYGATWNGMGGGTLARDLYISNKGFTGTKTASTGLRIRASGGEDMRSVQITEPNTGVLIDPPDGGVQYLYMENVAPDSCGGDGFVLDATLGGVIGTLRLGQCWSSYNGLVGLRCKAVNYGDGRPALRSVRWSGGYIGQNVQEGVRLEGGTGIAIEAVTIARNSRSTGGAYDGVYAAAGVGGFAIRRCRIGNDDGTTSQRYAFYLAAGAGTGITLTDNDTSGNWTGDASINATGTVTYVNFTGVLPKYQPAIDSSVTVKGSAGQSLTAYADTAGEVVMESFVTATPATKGVLNLNKYGGMVKLPLTLARQGMSEVAVALTDAATVALDSTAGNMFTLLATSGVGATRALGLPANLPAGATAWCCQILYTQDGTGGRALTGAAGVTLKGTVNTAASGRTLVTLSTFDGGASAIAVATSLA